MGIIFDFQLQRKSLYQKTVHLRIDEKGLSIDGENQFLHIKVFTSSISSLKPIRH